MASLNAKLKALGFDSATDYKLEQGPAPEFKVYISEWASDLPKPDEDTLNAITDQQVKNASENREMELSFEVSRKDKTLIKWIASRTGGGTAQSIKAELKAIWDSIN